MRPPQLLLLLIPAVLGKLDFDIPDGFLGNDLTQLYSRDAEPLPAPVAFGHKFMSGGAGEGKQHLSPEGHYPNKEEIKTDAILPAYCEPPNPCPIGFAPSDGCITDFENTADFSRDHQGKQDCLCDEEHMFSCPSQRDRMGVSENIDDFSAALDELLDKHGIDAHKGLIAKKFHAKRTESEGSPRKKRSSKRYLWQKGEALKRKAKKGYKI